MKIKNHMQSGWSGIINSPHEMKILIRGNLKKSRSGSSGELEIMQMAVGSLNAGTWMLDMATRSLVVCDRCKEVIPIFKETSVKIGQLYNMIEVRHVNEVVKAITIALRTDGPVDLEVPIAATNGLPRKWLRLTGKVAREKHDPVPRLFGMIEDITERKDVDILKLDQLAMASHDLKSPLTVIKLYIQLSAKLAKDTGNKTLREHLEKAELQVHQMNCLIESYLEPPGTGLSQLEDCLTTFDIKNLLMEVIDDLLFLNPGNVIFLKPGASLMVLADREKIARVLQNLLSNAVKYSSGIDAIIVHFGKVGNYMQVGVEDHGIGIAYAEQAKVFDRFYRVDCKGETEIKGHGIGLYLSKNIIKQHNGEIWLKSEFNKGSKFFFKLPLLHPGEEYTD
jgi:two-component system sensor histidine kinase VicK